MKISQMLAALALAATSVGANANLVVNGDFENPGVAAGTYTIFPTPFPGWVVNNDVEIRNALVGNANTGANYAELDTTVNGSIIQKLTTISGATYAVSFAYSPREGVAAGSNGIEALFNGVSLGIFDGSGLGNTGNVWQNYSFNVTASSTVSTIEFRALGISDGLGGSLDSVAVNAVPLPGTLALLGLGFAGMAMRGRRSRAA